MKASVPVVLLHGWGFDHRIWNPLVKVLENDREVLAIDLPGYGHHQADGPLSFEDCLAILASRLPEGALLCGWSMGGVLATHVCAKIKSRGVITLATHPYWYDAMRMQTVPWVRFQLMALSNRSLLRVVRADFSYPCASDEVLQASLRWCAQDCRELWVSPTVPMMHYYGQDDHLVPMADRQGEVFAGGHDFWWDDTRCHHMIAEQLQQMEGHDAHLLYCRD